MPNDYYSSFFGGNGSNNQDYVSEDPEFDRFIIKGAKKTFSRIFGALALYTVIAVALSFITSFVILLISKELYNSIFGTALGQGAANAIIMYLICIPIFYLMVRKMETRTVWKKRFTLREFIEILAISELLMTAGNYIGVFLNTIIGSLMNRTITNTVSESISSSPIWVMIVFSVILAPIAEELLMRKLLLDRLSKYGSGFALIISAIAFGLFHGNFYQFFYATFLGFVLGYLYLRGGLKYSILLHMIINFMGSVGATLYTDAADQIIAAEDPTKVAPTAALIVLLYSAITYGLMLYGLVLLFVKFRRGELSLKPLDDARIRIPEGARTGAVLSNPGTIFFLIVSVLNIIFSLFL